MSVDASGLVPLSSRIDSKGPLELALLVRRTGTILDAWARNGVSHEVVSVMTATLIASLDAIVEAVGGTSTQTAVVETDDRFLIATKVDGGAVLLLVAPRSMGIDQLRRKSLELARDVGGPRARAPRGGHARP